MDKKEKEKELEGGGITKSRSEFEERGINLQAKKESCFKGEGEESLPSLSDIELCPEHTHKRGVESPPPPPNRSSALAWPQMRWNLGRVRKNSGPNQI